MLIKCSLVQATHRFIVLPWRLIAQLWDKIQEWSNDLLKVWAHMSVCYTIYLLRPTQACAGLPTTNTTEFYTFTPRPVEYSITTSTEPTSLQCSEKNKLTCTKTWPLLICSVQHRLCKYILCKSRRYLSIVGICHVIATATGRGEGRGCYWAWQV